MDFDLRRMTRLMHQAGPNSFQELSDWQLRFLANSSARELINRNSPRMKYWISHYEHRHGDDHSLHYSMARPELSDVIPGSYKHDRSDEWLNLEGPYEMWDEAMHGDQPNFDPGSFQLFFEEDEPDAAFPFPEGGLIWDAIPEFNRYVTAENFNPEEDMCPACGAGDGLEFTEDDDSVIQCSNCYFEWTEIDQG